MPTIFPSLEEALELHRMLIDRFGGSHGVRDLGALESAIYRPQTGYYETLADQAAALLQSLVLNHACVDGNKRLAFALTAVFLRMNGFNLRVSANDAEVFLIGEVIERHASREVITEWIGAHMHAS